MRRPWGENVHCARSSRVRHTPPGPVGVGKTRIALHVVVADAFADRPRLVGLATITGRDLVWPTIAQALSVHQTCEETLRERLRAFQRDIHLMLVRDSFEHVVEAAPFVNDSLAACPAYSPSSRAACAAGSPGWVPATD